MASGGEVGRLSIVGGAGVGFSFSGLSLRKLKK